MSYLEERRKEVASGSYESAEVYSTTDQRLKVFNLGSGIRLEVLYLTNDDDIGLDNIDEAILYHNGKSTVLEQEDIEMFATLEVL